MTDDLLDQATRARVARDEDNRQRRWVESIMHKRVDEAARLVGARGNALLLWIDASGEMRAARISREASTLREHVPDFLTKRGPR